MADPAPKELPSASSVSTHEPTDDVEDRKIEASYVRKIDLYIMPIIMLVQLISFLDRSNIGNAKVYGLTTDLHLVGQDFNVVTSLFYVTYIIFEIPYNILQQRIGAKKLIPGIVIAWSLVTTFSGFCKSYGGLIACRLVLGFCEAGLFPGLNFYLSTLYTRDEVAKRVCMLLVATALSGAFGGLIAYGVLQMDGIQGVAGWRWLFYIEGIISFVVGLVTFLLPNWVEDAKFLTAAEKDVGRARTARVKEDAVDNSFRWHEVRAALTSPICWLSGAIQFGSNTCLYGFSVFLPTIIQGMGYKSLKIQYLTIPIYVWGALVFVIAVQFMSLIRFRHVSVYMLFLGSFTIIGYIILLASTKSGVKYFATYLVTTGLYSFIGLSITWILNNTPGRYKRAVAIAMNQTFGNAGGVVAGQIYITSDAPRYIIGQAVSLAAFSWALIGTVIMNIVLRTKNAAKDRKIAAGVVEDENDRTLGDNSIYFKYRL